MTMKNYADAVNEILASKFDDGSGRGKASRFPSTRSMHSTEREITIVDVRGVHITFYVNPANAVCVFVWDDVRGNINTKTVALAYVIQTLEEILQARR